MTGADNKYLAFLSFSSQDNRGQRPSPSPQEVSRLCWGNWLHEALKTFSIPADFVGQVNGRGEIIPDQIHTFFGEGSGQSDEAALTAEDRKALEQSLCLVVICSPRSAQNVRVNEAVRYFKQLGRSRNILPIVVSGEPHASDGSKPGASPEDECFVPALRHPVGSDGAIDLTRRAGRCVFVDARYGDEKREILANDHWPAQADLERAKIHLIALLIGVGFNGLWWREQKRHFHDFADAQEQVRTAVNQVEEARRQLQEAQRQIREAQNQVLETQNLPRDVQGQIQEAHHQAQEAQNQTQAAQQQLLELQNKVRDTQAQLEEARERARAAENKVLEAQAFSREVQGQLEQARHQARELPHSSSQSEGARSPAGDGQDPLLEAKSQIQEFQNQARSAHAQWEEAHNRALAAESKVLEVQNQLEAARNQVREAQSLQRQLEEKNNQGAGDDGKFIEVQRELEAARIQAREAQNRIVEAQAQATDAQSRLLEIQSQSRNAGQEVQSQIQEAQKRTRNARRLTGALALLAVLSLLAASQAMRQRQVARQTLDRAAAEAAGDYDLATGALDPARIRQVLGDIGGAERDGSRRRSLDQLAAAIPREQIPEALKMSSVILNDSQRSHFQKWLLVRLGWENPLTAMASASGIEGIIVNEQGASDSATYFQLAVLEDWMKRDLPGAFNWVCQMPDAGSRARALGEIIPALAADNPQNTLARLNELQPAPDERTYQLLFQCWAEKNPQAAGQAAREHLGSSGDTLGKMTEAWIQNGWPGILQCIPAEEGTPDIMQLENPHLPGRSFF